MSSFKELHDPILLHIATFLDAEDLSLRFERLCRRLSSSFGQLDYEASDIWYKLCCIKWPSSSYPKYRGLKHRRLYYEEEHPQLSPLPTWKRRYVWLVHEMKRTILAQDELHSLDWWFNFTPPAGGRGDETLCRVQFIQGFLFVPQFLPMPFRLVVEEEDEEQEQEQEQERDRENSQERQQQQQQQQRQRQRNPRRQQYLHVYDFPPHRVTRLFESGE